MSALRLFFALWPSIEEARATHDLADLQLSGVDCKRVPTERLHLTLAFLGSIASEHLPTIEAAAQSTAGERFALTLNRLGCWRRKGIAWLAPTESPPELEVLRSILDARLNAAGHGLEKRNWRPHVTLARKVTGSVKAATVEPVRWRIRDFVLVRSVTHASGPEYTIMSRYSLGVRAPPATL